MSISLTLCSSHLVRNVTRYTDTWCLSFCSRSSRAKTLETTSFMRESIRFMFEFIPRTQAANMFICKNIIHVVYFANIGTHENGGVWSESKKYQIHSQPVFVLSLKSEKILVEAKVLSAPGGGGTQQGFTRGGSAPRSNPSPFMYHF